MICNKNSTDVKNFTTQPCLMFHEILDDWETNSGFHLRNKGKYTITKNKFDSIIKRYGDSVNYTFDDGGVSNLYAAKQLKLYNLKGIFFIPTGYIGKPGFLDLNEVKLISKDHFVFSHSHNHLQKKVDLPFLEADWINSLNFMKKNGFNSDTICLPAGYYTRTHNNLFKELKIQYVFHSAPVNFIIRLLFPNNIKFIPRLVVTTNFNSLNKYNYSGIKSSIKQIINFVNY